MGASSANHFMGNYGKATINGTEVFIDGWKADVEAEKADATSTRTAGYKGVITGNKSCTFSVNMPWDAGLNPLDSPPGLMAGQTLTNVRLYLNGTSSPCFIFPFAKAIKNSVASQVGARTDISTDCESDGTFTAPTGGFTPQ